MLVVVFGVMWTGCAFVYTVYDVSEHLAEQI